MISDLYYLSMIYGYGYGKLLCDYSVLLPLALAKKASLSYNTFEPVVPLSDMTDVFRTLVDSALLDAPMVDKT